MLQVYKSTKNRLAALNKSIKNFSFVCRLYRFSKYDFFQVIFDFRFFRIFDGFKIYFLFSLFLFLYSSFSVPLSVPLLLSVPFLIHYDIYNIYQYSITFYPAIIAIIASVPGFAALQILQPFRW